MEWKSDSEEIDSLELCIQLPIHSFALKYERDVRTRKCPRDHIVQGQETRGPPNRAHSVVFPHYILF